MAAVTIMTGQTITRRKPYIISATLLGASLILWFCAMVSSRWEQFTSFPIFSAAIGTWIIWVVHLAGLGIEKARERRTFTGFFIFFFGFLFLGFIAFIITWGAGLAAGRCLCVYEVQRSLNAGLRNDCLKLLQNWPTREDRIGHLKPEFSNLPQSIRMLSPLYVINDNVRNTNFTPNIGICKNGFGGFACGVRVFQNDDDGSNYFGPQSQYDRIRLAPGVYVLWGSM